MEYLWHCLKLVVNQVFELCKKHLAQKRIHGRDTLKELFVPIIIVSLTIYFLILVNDPDYVVSDYSVRPLPELSDSGKGIFTSNSADATTARFTMKILYYTPKDHPGVNDLINSLTTTYKDIDAKGVGSRSALNYNFERDLFDTWAGLEFDLSDEQLSTGQLVTSQTNASKVKYTLRINPMASILPTDNYDDNVFNKLPAPADAWIDSGYLTLQNYISTYLASKYTTVPPGFAVNTFVQRYPKSDEFDDYPNVDWATTRFMLWKWMGSVVLTISIFYPILSFLTQAVRERQMRMKDLLEISGLYPVSFWLSFVVTNIVFSQATTWFVVLILLAGNTFTVHHILPYVDLITCYTLSVTAFCLCFGFIVPRSEYYGLPAFLSNTMLAVGGNFIANEYNLAIGAKLFISFLFPPIGLTMGIFSTETYLYHHSNDPLNYDHVDNSKNLPSLNAINGILVASAVFYFLIALYYPFDFLFSENFTFDNFMIAKQEEVQFPCDVEEDVSEARPLLEVKDVYHVYPDGTQAVKGMSFTVREGEVLSFLGSNGAGKSTTMGMLSGTIDATCGDAYVNGHSITRQRGEARRNLGICFQQDIIWDDISVEDHLFLFARLRGYHGEKLRTDVKNMLDSLGFPDKAKSLAGTLSGGQKRRLCVGISMVGGNSVCYLDEPTAGLDPVSRRQLWELVQKNRAGRAILLTTHFMDEADVLGDRIAIVKEGRLRAIGSSSFLKQRFGLGYLLRASLRPETNAKPIVEKINGYVPRASVVSSAGTELAIRLPKSAVEQFPFMFENLEAEGGALGVLSYGIETTTLEEVFLRIVNEDPEMLLRDHDLANRLLGASAEEREDQSRELSQRDNQRYPLSEDMFTKMLTKGREPGASVTAHTFWGQVKVLLWKRYNQFFRSRGQWTFGFIVPIAICAVSAIIIADVPTDIVDSSPGVTNLYYETYSKTPVTGEDEADTLQWSSEAGFGSSAEYVGQNYTDLYDYVATDTLGSSNGVFFNSQTNFTVMYNSTMGINFPGIVGNLLQSAISDATGGLLEVEDTCEPFPTELMGLQLNLGLSFGFLLALLAGGVAAGLSIVIGGERVGLVKHQQLASGTSITAYWTANFIFDFVVLFFHIIVLGFCLFCASSTSFGGEGFEVVIGAGFIYTITMILRFYCLSYTIADVRTAQTFYFYGSLLSIYFLCTQYVTYIVTDDMDALSPNAIIISMCWTVVDPSFGYLVIILFQHNFLGVKTFTDDAHTLSAELGGYMLLMMFLSAIVYLCFLVYMEAGNSFFGAIANMCSPRTASQKTIPDHRGSEVELSGPSSDVEDVHVVGVGEKPLFAPRQVEKTPRERHAGMQDPDVMAEKEFVATVFDGKKIDRELNAIFINKLNKIYYGKGTVPTKHAVKGICLNIPHGEIFGLLGANGAGKTTLLKMVSGLELPTSGRAFINGFDVVTHKSEAQRSMGLCPQFDTLVDRLSVRENLLFFGRIKGLEVHTLDTICDSFMDALNIRKYENKLIQHLSGGNRRKVSLAVALLGAPPTVYLDEPSTGLDPVASRLMWRLLSRVNAAKNSSIVLTTHNMLECEAVCTRIGIMKNGELVCIGDSQHLRSAHGTGFLLEMTLDPSKMDDAKAFVMREFREAVVIDEHPTIINFEIPKRSIAKLSEAFRLLESRKASLGVVDYALSQSTLEQVFLKQIRSTEDPNAVPGEEVQLNKRTPRALDYFIGYIILLLAFFIPGLHHFWLGNIWRGLKYFFTVNEFFIGWVLDIFEMHVLIQKSVEEHGNHACCFGCCSSCCCCSCCATRKRKNSSTLHTRMMDDQHHPHA